MLNIHKHVDEKSLAPTDTTISKADYKKHYDKPVRGYVVISDQDGTVLETPNLVLLSGREFLAQKLADMSGLALQPASDKDLTNFKVRYFGVGIGGADSAEQPNKVGPFDNDLDLRISGKFADVTMDTEETLNYNQRYQYLHNGILKKIQSDQGNIEVIKEDHSIVVDGVEVPIQAYTTVKYTMNIRANELYKEPQEQGPFAFNEAALYAVEYADKISGGVTYNVPAMTEAGTEPSRYVANYRTFARFTCLTKWLEERDSLRIEWYILV